MASKYFFCFRSVEKNALKAKHYPYVKFTKTGFFYKDNLLVLYKNTRFGAS